MWLTEQEGEDPYIMGGLCSFLLLSSSLTLREGLFSGALHNVKLDLASAAKDIGLNAYFLIFV